MSRPTLALLISLASCASSSSRPPTGTHDVAPVDVPAPDDAQDAGATDAAPLTCGTCAGGYAALDGAPRVAAGALTEASGIVESRRRPGAFFVHNDSGDSARFFAIDAQGRLLAEYRLAGAGSDDWEDIAVGPCGDGTCVYLADIGDNDAVRAGYTVYRVREPEAPASPPASVTPTAVTWDALPFRYPDGAHNAETLLAHPTTGDLYVITKVTTGASAVFRFPAAAQGATTTTLTPVGELNLPRSGGSLVTGGDLHPCARRMLVRTYLRLFEYVVPEGEPFENIFSVTPSEVPTLAERQGEAVGWRVDGRGYVTTSEGPSAPLNSFGCERP